MAAFQTFPLFYPSSSQILTASDLNLIRENVRLIDGWSYRNEPAFDSSTGVDTNTPGYYVTTDPLRIWWGAARFVAGCTTLTVEGRGVRTNSELLKVYVNGGDVSGSGTLLGTITVPASIGDFSQSFSISGYNDGDVVTIELVISGTHGTTGTYIINDVYLSPVAKSGWVAAPSFASVADITDASKLTALCTACGWVYDRMRLVPMPTRQALFYNLGPFKPTTDPQHLNRPIYYGSIGKYYSNAALRLKMWIVSTTTVGWNFVVYLNGTAAYSSPTYGIGGQQVDQTISLSGYTLGSRVRVHILASTVTAGTANPLRFTRWTNGVLHAVADSGGWPYATLPAAFTGPSATTNANTLRGNLASLSTIVNDTKARIDARGELWGRSRAVRRHYTKNGATEQILQARARHSIWQRTGSELFVKGSDIKLGYGPLSVEIDAEGNGWENYTHLVEEAVDNAQNGTTLYLDDFDALDYGTAYRILGSAVYAAEYIG